MFNNTGFITRKRGLGAQGGLAPQPNRSITITPVVANATAVVFNITSNMVDGQPILKFDFTGLNGNVFLDPIEGNIQLDANGSATLTKNLNTSISVSNQFFALNLRSQSNVLFATSSNVEIRNVRSGSFSGGTVTTADGYRVNRITTVGATTITKTTSTDPWFLNPTVVVETVGGGGAGWAEGGQGGNVRTADVQFSSIATTTTAYVGEGGLASIQPSLDNDLYAYGGNSSSYLNITATGGNGARNPNYFPSVVENRAINAFVMTGSAGGNGNDTGFPTIPPDYFSGKRPVFDETPPTFSVTGGTGGGGVISVITGDKYGGGGGGQARLTGSGGEYSLNAYAGPGLDGGGNGGVNFSGSGSGTPNTGGGGGGGGTSASSGSGGSGLVHFKYPYKGSNYPVFVPN